MKHSALILLSGGLDSYIALDIAAKKYDVKFALNFDYGQKAFKKENSASKKIARKYRLDFETIKLPFLKALSNNALTDIKNTKLDEFKEVWIPNRNGLFLNIAACYCDKYNIDNIIIGANLEEARDFPDNSKKFINASVDFLKYSTLAKVKVVAPCINMKKVDIVNYAIDNNLDLNLIKSCYNNSTKKHCGICLSCRLLYNAVISSKKPELVKELF